MNEIYYYSGTGTAKKVAMDLSAQLGDTKIISIFKCRHQSIQTKGKTVGIVFPVHSMSVPRLVSQVIKQMDFGTADYIYAVATMGGVYGNAFMDMEKILKQKGKKLAASFAIDAGSNTNLFIDFIGGTPVLDEKAQEEKSKALEKRIRNIGQWIQAKKSIKEEGPNFKMKLTSSFATMAFRSMLGKFDQKFHAEKCTKCGKCVSACPKGNISETAQGVQWNGKCEACLRCFNLCPEQAILYDKMKNPKMYDKYTKYLDLVLKDESRG